MPSRKLIEAAVRIVRSLPGFPDLRVLDLSCGDGYLVETLAREGCRVEGTHYRPDDYIYKQPSEALASATVHPNIDLTQPLPFPDSAFDVVLATEVLEHLPSHVLPCAEAARILRPEGHFIFSTPNIHRLSSRLQFLFTGQHELRSARLGWHVPPGDLYSTHFNPVYFPVVHTLLHHNGLRIRRLAFSKTPFWAPLLLALYPAVVLATAVEARHAWKRSPEGGRDLFRWMADVRMLLSDKLIVVAQKAPPASLRNILQA